jgi:hypothetical protein
VRYEVLVELEVRNKFVTMTLENRSQWRAFQALYLDRDEVQQERQEQDRDMLVLARRFEEKTGVACDSFLTSTRTDVIVGD